MVESYIPPIPTIPSGFSQTTPYYGDNAPQGIFPSGTSPAGGGTLSTYTDSSGRIDYPRMQRELGLTNAQMDQLLVIGQSSPWLSPDEMRAKLNALNTGSAGDGFGGGGGGSAGGGALGSGSSSGSSSSLGGGLLGGTAVQQPSGPNVSGFPNISTGALTNYLPLGSGQPGSQPDGQVNGQVGGQLGMMQAGPQDALNQYYNTAGYQLTNGPGAVNRFQISPGYQFAVNQALQQVQNNAASRGLLDSGAALRAMTDRAQGMANQEYNNWQQNQQNQYNQYQNRLAGLAGGPTGADYAFQTGQGMGNTAMQTGGNIGTILANQGNTLFGGIVGAGGAQAQNVTQAGNMQAQILGGNLSTQLAAAALAGR